MIGRSRHTLPNWAPRLVGIVIASIVATIAAGYVLLQISNLLSWLLVSLFLSFALEPIVNQLVHRGWSRNIATSVVLLAFGGMAVVLVAAMIPLFVQQVTEVVKQSPDWLTSLLSTVNSVAGTNISSTDIIDKLSLSDQAVTNYVTNIANNVLGFGRQLLYVLLQVLAILLFTFYFVSDGPYLRRVICSFLSPKQQKIVLTTWEIAIEKTGGFMVSRIILGGISTVAHYIALTIIGVPFALPLAIWVGVVSQFLPIIGTYIAAALPLLVAVLQSPTDALVLMVFIVAYQQLENYILGPKIAAHTMELHPAVAFGAVIAGASIGGIIGAFVALPIAAMLQEIAIVYLNRNEVIESKLTETTTDSVLKNKTKP
ncbi:MAG: AI-2E family transporter [Candidatus Saccharimonadales bacterium]